MSDNPNVGSPNLSSDLAKNPTNIERLQSHLAEDSLPMALLSAWMAGSDAEASARLLAALNNFMPQNATGTDDSQTK